MKKIMTLALALMMMGGCVQAQEAIKLPQPKKESLNMPLGEALQNRRSYREYTVKEINLQQLSTLLWAASGVNDPQSGKLTAPTAVNMQDIKIYVCTAQGVCLYNAKENTLVPVISKDIREALAGPQKFAAHVAVNLLLVSDQSTRDRKNEHYGAMDAGYVSQNIYLACAAMGLRTVARAMMNQEVVRKELSLTEGAYLELNHPIGY